LKKEAKTFVLWGRWRVQHSAKLVTVFCFPRRDTLFNKEALSSF
jgi:hypothetical protein